MQKWKQGFHCQAPELNPSNNRSQGHHHASNIVDSSQETAKHQSVLCGAGQHMPPCYCCTRFPGTPSCARCHQSVGELQSQSRTTPPPSLQPSLVPCWRSLHISNPPPSRMPERHARHAPHPCAAASAATLSTHNGPSVSSPKPTCSTQAALASGPLRLHFQTSG